MDVWVITFLSVSHALRAEKLLKNEKISSRLIPIPRELGPVKAWLLSSRKKMLRRQYTFWSRTELKWCAAV